MKFRNGAVRKRKNTEKTPKPQQKQTDIDFDKLLLAIKDVKINGKSKQATAKAYNIKRTNLRRYLNKLDDELPDITALVDTDLVQMLHRYTERNPPLMVCFSLT